MSCHENYLFFLDDEFAFGLFSRSSKVVFAQLTPIHNFFISIIRNYTAIRTTSEHQ